MAHCLPHSIFSHCYADDETAAITDDGGYLARWVKAKLCMARTGQRESREEAARGVRQEVF